MADILSGCAANLCSEAAKCIFQEAKRHIRYAFIYKKNVEEFEEKLGSLIARRERVQLVVDDAKRNLEVINPEVEHWFRKVDEKIEEKNKVRDLEDKAKNRCFFSLCPNVKSRYQLSRKAEGGASAFDELFRQGEFNSVSCPAPPPDIVDATPKDFEAFKSREKVFNDVMETLKKATINVIGVYGMGGMGKTTLVNEVARQVKKDKLFDEVVMAVVTRTPDILTIQDELARFLGLKLEGRSEVVRADQLRERLKTEKKEKKVLIILDDIWTELDLNKVGIPFGECYILLTSRNLNVLNKMEANENFEVGVLEDKEAWDLFKKMAGENVESYELKSTAIEVANKCAGLPLAIKTVARALRNKDLFAWKDALRKLPVADVYSAIMLSYNHLESEELKQIFLLCSLVRPVIINDLLKYAMGLGLMDGVSTVEGARNMLLTTLSQLKESCLLLDSTRKRGFDVHDLVYDAMSTVFKDCRMFASKEGDDLQNWLDGEEMKCYNLIYLPYPSICKLPDELNCPQLVLFLLLGEGLSLPTNFFNKTANLSVLDLTRMHFSSLPSSIRLLTSLRTLCLDQCKLGEIAIIGELNNLESLSLLKSDIRSLPKEIGRLFKLKLLDLSFCHELEIIPAGILSGLSRLEELYMGGTSIRWEVGGPSNQQSNASLDELQALSRLTTLDVDILDANATPWDLFFEKLQKLEKYKILIGMKSEMGWSIEYEYSRTLILKLRKSIVHLNQGIKLKKTEDLHFCELKGVKIALQKLKGEESFSHLKKLCIQNGSEIKYIINDNDVAGEFPHLRSLKLEDLPQLISFCSEEKSGSTSIPKHELPLFNEKVSFPCLEELHLSRINVERIWHIQSSNGSFCTYHSKLTSLTIDNCVNLKQLFSSSMARRLVHLKHFKISGCKLLREIIFMEGEDIEEEENKAAISFPQLNTLEISTCPELKGFIFKSAIDSTKSLFSDKVLCPNLETLHVGGCHNLEYLFPSSLIKHFKQLLELNIYRCENMEEVILVDGLAEAKSEAEGEGMTTQMSFPKLEKLYLFSLPKLVRFCHEGDNSKSDALALFDEKVSFPCLEKLHLSSINVERIWHNQPSNGSFCTYHPTKLTSLIIKDSSNIKHLLSSSMARRLVHLKDFEIRGCKLLREIIFTEDEDIDAISFPQLNTLRVEDCTELKGFIFNSATDTKKSFFSGKVSFPCLEKLHLSKINVERISHNQPSNGSFCTHPNLTSLTITDCDNLKQLFSSSMARGLMHLKDFEISECKLLREIIFTEDEDIEEENRTTISFSQLNTLMIMDCPELKGFIFNSATDTKKSFFSDKVLCPNLKTLEVWSCHNLKYMFPSSLIKHFKQLGKLNLYDCENMEEVIFVDGLAEAEAEGITTQMLFPELEQLELQDLPKLVRFCNGGNNSSDALALFDEKVAFPSLQELIIEGMGMWSKIWHHKVAMERLEKLETLRIWDCESLEEIIEFPEHGFNPKLKGFNFKLHNLKYLDVTGCNKVKAKILGGEYLNFGETQPLFWVSNQETFSNLVPSFVSFQNLTDLVVSECHGFINLVTLTVAKSMVQLKRMSIMNNQMMEEIVASSTRDEVMDGIVFSKLKSLRLGNLPSLSSFFSGNCTFEFPSLEELIMNQCPKMEIFSKGELSTPMLQGIKTEYGGNYVGHYEGNLNATVKQLFIEQDVQNSKEEKEEDDD